MGEHTECIQESGQRTTNERQDGEGGVYISGVHIGEEEFFSLRCSMYGEENGEDDGNGQPINS